MDKEAYLQKKRRVKEIEREKKGKMMKKYENV